MLQDMQTATGHADCYRTCRLLQDMQTATGHADCDLMLQDMQTATGHADCDLMLQDMQTATGHADYVNVAWLLGKISPNHFDELLLAIVICDNVLKHEINQQFNPMSAKK